MTSVLRGLFSWPATCEICARWPAQPICTPCLQRFARHDSRCPTCALPLAPGLLRRTTCDSASPPPWRQVVACVDYDHPWTDLIGQLKTESAWARHLADVMRRHPAAVEMLNHAEWVAPIALSDRKLRQRGYNQAWELIKSLRQRGDAWQAHPNLLTHRDSTDQHRLDKHNRLLNARRSIGVHPQWKSRLHGRRIVLVDDVMTTGATLHAAALALLEAGASEVSGLVFARTPAPSAD